MKQKLPETNVEILDRLYELINRRRGGDIVSSYTAKLFEAGTAHIAQKVGEEAIETVIEALKTDGQKLAEESADLLYHLLVLWSDQGIQPKDVWAVLNERFGKSGLDNK